MSVYCHSSNFSNMENGIWNTVWIHRICGLGGTTYWDTKRAATSWQRRPKESWGALGRPLPAGQGK